MPYIEKGQRELIDGPSDFTTRYGLDSFLFKMTRLCDDYCKVKEGWPCKPGTLNYIITKVVHWKGCGML